MRFTNEGRDRRVTPSYKLFIELSVQPIYLFSVSIHRNIEKHISMDSNHKLAVLETAVLPITPPMHNKKSVQHTPHTLTRHILFLA